MGSETGETNERPVHPVYLDAFWIDETEVTNKMYEKCVKDLACPQPSKTTHYSNPAYVEHPVVFVSWNGAEKYCKWAGRTLPTEAQWEKAARGENGRDYPWGSDPPDINRLNFASQVGDTRPANSYPDGASPYLVLNMAGNVAEWVADRMGDYKAGSTASKNPEGPARGNLRVVRGGAWQNYRDLVRSTYRVGYDPRQSYDYIGFRCAISAALEN